MSPRFAAMLVTGCALTLLAASPAAGHEGGKAEPRISAAARGTGAKRLLVVQLVDVDSRAPIVDARVTAGAEMTSPHTMRLSPWVLRTSAGGIYTRRVTFPMPARWTVTIRVEGRNVVPTEARLTVPIARTPAPVEGSGLAPLPTRLEDDLTERDVETMIVLWLHGLAAMGWIVGVVIMALALSVRPQVLADGLRQRLREAYVGWGAWLHWGLVPVIVLTGVYNMLEVTPFTLIWRPRELEQLANIPYGALYEAILLVKLGLFAALLVTGTLVLSRTVRAKTPAAPAGDGFVRTLASALGPAGLTYLAVVPLILGAAMALRYVHVLSHVAEVIAGA